MKTAKRVTRMLHVVFAALLVVSCGGGGGDDTAVSLSANLVTTKVVDDGTPDEGQAIVYTLIVTNNGPDSASNVSVTDVLPSGMSYVSDIASQGSYVLGTGVWSVGVLGNGSSATLAITASVDAGEGGKTITNTVTNVSLAETDPTGVGDDLSESVVVNVPGLPTAGISITPANAELIAATVVNSVQIVEGISTLPGFLPGVAVNPAGGSFNYPDFFLKQLQWLPALANQSNTGSLTGFVVPATVVDCTDPLIGGTAGTVTVSGDVADPSLNTITAGDQFDLDFNACVLDGIELNGGMSLTVITIPPNFDGTPPFSVKLAAVLSGFSANDAGFIVTGDGDMTIQLDADTIGNLITVLSGTSLLASATGAAEQLTNFLFNIADNLVTGDYSVDLSGTIATTALGGSVSFVTNLPFTGNDNVANDPTAGEMHITTTADSSQERVTALTNGVDVMIEVDADGDSSYETTIMTTWTALRTP